MIYVVDVENRKLPEIPLAGWYLSYGTRILKWPWEKLKPAAQNGCSCNISLIVGTASGCDPWRRYLAGMALSKSLT